MMIPVPTTPSNFVSSLATMTPCMFGGSVFAATPYTGLKDLPSFLVGAPMINAIQYNVYACAFDSGPVHAYGFRHQLWGSNELNIDLMYSGLNYNGVQVKDQVNEVVYKYFPSPTFNISTFSYMCFFTRTPWP